MQTINNQHTLSDKYGNGFSRSNGCAWIAAYNVFLLSGYYLPEEEIKNKLIESNGLILGGTFGTRPKAVYRLLKDQFGDKFKVGFLRSLSVRQTEEFAVGSEYIIITNFWYSRASGRFLQSFKSIRAAAHTFAGRCVGGDRFEFHNETYNSKVICTVGELFGKKNNGQLPGRTFPLCVISVRKCY